MHTQTQLREADFAIRLDGAPATVGDLFPHWHRHDRFGLIIHDALGGVGASHLLQLAIWSYYDVDKRRRDELTVYPEIYAFHVGGGHGSHADYDFWGPRREVILGADPGEVLSAINSHGITRLAVPDRAGGASAEPPVFDPKEIGAAQDLVASAFAYSPTGRTPHADVTVDGLHRRTEENPTKVLNAFRAVPAPRPGARMRRPLKEGDTRFAEYQQRRASELSVGDVAGAVDLRERIRIDGLASETYRRISLDEALNRLMPDER
jgi:hypothetical protein